MKSKCKKIITGALCVIMVLGMAGCGEKNETVQNEKKNSFTYWANMPAGIVSVYQSMGEIKMYQQMEKETGIHIEFIHPAAGQVSEQFTLMMASREFPDFIEYNWNSYAGGAEKALEDNVIIKLNDLFDSVAPNVKKMIESDENYEKLVKTDSGAYFCFPALNTGSYRIFGGPIIRKDWLDELGLSVPETIEDWETVLRAFKEKKGATAPFTADASLMSSSELTNAFNTAFNVGKGLYIRDGKVVFGPMENGYKEWLQLMNKWYAEGIIDNDYNTNSSSAIEAKVANGYTGAFFGYVGGSIGKYLTMMKQQDPKFDLVGVPYPVMNKGDKVNFAAIESDVLAGAALSITSACTDPETAAKWADNWYTEKGRMLSTFGVEGETYTMVDGKPVYTDTILKNPDGYSISEMLQQHCRATAASPGFNTEDEYLEQYYEYDRQKEAFKTWSGVTEDARKHLMPPITPTIEESEEFAALSADIDTYVSEMVFKFVCGTEPIENYDSFVEELKEIGIERYLEINQNAYERYLNR
ncbi:MAG: extracellular solute-binding protein [Clostridia bacterium]|nr:extracellular solute-binding protein [Clostridia bacterium]